MSTKARIVFAAALILGTASAALANDSGENNQGGFVMPGRMDGVNPVYHPDIFGNPALARAYYGFVLGRDQVWRVEANCHVY